MPFHRSSHTAYRAADLAEAKGDHVISVCLPARNEAETVAMIVDTIRTELVERVPLVDEIMVVDDHSTDDTAAVAASAGATVVDARSTLPETTGPGKGQALWKSLHESVGDIVAWCDADIESFGAHFVTGLVGPLLTRPETSFVKGTYRRPLIEGEGGGRVTELVARPVLASLFPELAGVGQPLAGEYAGRRSLLERLPFVEGYGVDIALLLDAAALAGADALAEVELGERRHRNRTLDELGPMAAEVLRSALSRAGFDADGPVALRRPDREPLVLRHIELPPLVELTSYRRRTA